MESSRLRLTPAASILVGVAFCTPTYASNFSVSGPGGAFADNSGGTYQSVLPGGGFTTTAVVAAPVTSVTSVVLTGITHTWVGDLQIVLKDPSGTGYNLMVRPGFTGAGFGNSGDFLSPGQTITFVPSGGAAIPDPNPTNIPTGSYNQHYGFTAPWINGNLGINNTNLSSISGAAGTWTLQIYDWAPGDVGSMTGWTLNGTDIVGVGGTVCEPGVAGVIGCACGNPPSGPGRGCDNSSSTGGAALTNVGLGSISADTLVFTCTGEKPTATSIVLQGDVTVVAGIAFGDGVRCAGGNLKRLYLKFAVGGVISAPTGPDLSVSLRSAALGDVLSAGVSRDYQVYYRDPLVFGCLLGPPATYNISQSRRVLWGP